MYQLYQTGAQRVSHTHRLVAEIAQSGTQAPPPFFLRFWGAGAPCCLPLLRGCSKRGFKWMKRARGENSVGLTHVRGLRLYFYYAAYLWAQTLISVCDYW
jgi:hypothetical protein